MNKGDKVLVITNTLYYYGTVADLTEDFVVLKNAGILTEVSNFTRTQNGEVVAKHEPFGCNGGCAIANRAIVSVVDGSRLAFTKKDRVKK